jgi:hypothetical protein
MVVVVWKGREWRIAWVSGVTWHKARGSRCTGYG